MRDPWGIVMEWDCAGLACRTWLREARKERAKMLAFETQISAVLYIDALQRGTITLLPQPYADLPHTTDTILVPRRFA